jgi:hypothetical protein
VNTYKDTMKISQQSSLGIKENAWLGIKYDSLLILGPEAKEEVMKVQYSHLKSIKVYPKLIQFEVIQPDSSHNDNSSLLKEKREDKLITLKFNTSQSYEISQLILKY